MKRSTWNAKGYLYIYDINGMTKFGITNDTARRKRQYRKLIQDLPMQEIRTYNFDHYWQAELVESMMRYRLKQWTMKDRYEWLVELPLQQVMDCFRQIMKVIKSEYHACECFHYHPRVRYDHYRDFFRMFQSKFDQICLA
ncbi:MAG: hypothetical protein JXR10_06970 [Cyclobacteriaceae bacterium]